MDIRVLEVLAALGCLALFIVLLVMLPDLVEKGMQGLSYVAALVVFIAALSIAGYTIDKMAV